MSNKVILKKSSVVSRVPTTEDLDYGELALNYADGKLYYKTSGNQIEFFLSGATTGVTSITGTSNQITASASTGSVTLSLPQNIHTGAAPTFAGATLNGSLGLQSASTSSAATQIPVFTANPASTTRTLVTRTPAQLRSDIGAGTGSVTSVGGTGTVSGLTLTGTVTTSGSLTLGGTLSVTASNFASQTANAFLAAPNGTAGVPTFRAIVAADVPTLNQNTTGTAANVTGTVAVANGGTGATTAANARTNLGATTVGSSIFTLSNPSAIRFLRVNADNTVTALSDADFRTAIGAYAASNPSGFTSNTGTVTSVGGTGTVSGLTLSGTVTTTGNLTLGGTLAVTPSNFASQTANTFLAAPNGTSGTPTFRTLVAADVPTLNQNTTGNAATSTTFSTGRTNYKGVTDGAVAGQLMWKHYGNSHTIIDASNSTAPDGTSINNTNAANVWVSTYPTLVGWNGSTTYGVRVDSARAADSATTAGSITSQANSATITASTAANANQIVLRDSNGDDFRRYGFASYFNMSHGVSGATADTIFYSSTDDYIRKNNATGFRASLNVPTRTGGDASGTWGINITGNAATATSATDSTKLPLAGGTITGSLGVNGNLTMGGTVIHNNSSTRDKYRLYSDNNYVIGMQSGITYGGLSDWGMTFQFNNDNARGFWWGDAGHSTAQGAMSLTTHGFLTVANLIRVGYGENDTTIPTSTTRFDVGGTSGQLFSIVDSLTGTLMAVNDSSGMPILEVTSSDEVIVSGQILCTGEITAYYSDERLKNKVGEITNALDMVMSLNGFKYTANELAVQNGYKNTGIQIGLSAQEVQKVLPEIVKLAAFDVEYDDVGNEFSKTGANYLTLDYAKLVPVLVEAIKEQQQRIVKLEKIISEKFEG
jgi:hypothetical protein